MQQMNKWHELEDDASRATIIVQKLTSHKEELRESLPRGTEPMPRRCVCVWRERLGTCHGTRVLPPPICVV